MMCGWLKDQYGVCWQVIPDGFREILTQADETKREKAMQAMMQMKKLDINQLNKILKDEKENTIYYLLIVWTDVY